jgi:hypothetical protein
MSGTDSDHALLDLRSLLAGSERCLLYCAMQSAEAFGAVRATVQRFEDPRNKVIWQVLEDQREEGIDPDLTTLVKELEHRGALDRIGGPAYVSSITEEGAHPKRVKSYLAQHRDFHAELEGYRVRDRIQRAALNGKTHAEFAELVQCEIAKLAELRRECVYDWKRLDVLTAVTAEPKPKEWHVRGVVGKGEAVTLVSQGGDGKTYMLAQIALDAALGRPALGMYDVPHPLKVLWIDEEMGESMLTDRLQRMARGNHLEHADLELLAANLDIRPQQGLLLADPNCAAEYDRTLREGRYHLVIADSLVALDTGDEKDGNAARAFYRQFIAPYKGSLGTSFLIAAHPPKPSRESHPDAQKTVRGSVDKRNSMDRTFWLERQSEVITDDSHVLTVVLRRDKQREAGSVDSHLIVIDGPKEKPLSVRSLGATGSPAAVESIGKVNACQHEILSRLRSAPDLKVYQADLVREIEAASFDKRRHYYPAMTALEAQRFVRVLDPIEGSGKSGKWIQLREDADAD